MDILFTKTIIKMADQKKFKDTAVGQFLSKVAPNVVDMVGDIFPPAKLLSGLFDKEPDIAPEQRLEFEKLVRDYEQQELKLYLEDIANARDMQKTALTNNDIFSKRFVPYLAAVSIFLGFAYIFMITFVAIPATSQRFADTILGVVISIVFGTIYNFFFGSSKGSADKNELIKNLKNQ